MWENKVDVIKTRVLYFLCSFHHLIFAQDKVLLVFNDATNYLQCSLMQLLWALDRRNRCHTFCPSYKLQNYITVVC